MKKRKISTAAFLAGVTTLAVSLPAMAETQPLHTTLTETSRMNADDFVAGADFEWVIDKIDA